MKIKIKNKLSLKLFLAKYQNIAIQIMVIAGKKVFLKRFVRALKFLKGRGFLRLYVADDRIHSTLDVTNTILRDHFCKGSVVNIFPRWIKQYPEDDLGGFDIMSPMDKY